jgi:hypothetical protein
MAARTVHRGKRSRSATPVERFSLDELFRSVDADLTRMIRAEERKANRGRKHVWNKFEPVPEVDGKLTDPAAIEAAKRARGLALSRNVTRAAASYKGEKVSPKALSQATPISDEAFNAFADMMTAF